MKKLIYIGFCILVTASCNQVNKDTKSTQAYLGIKEGGEWKWVTKSNGNEQYEYQAGVFKPVSELEVPPQHTDHSFYIQFEGPGWESDKIGYRLYLDWRNAIDIFGKKVDTMVLHKVGIDGFDSYHEIAGWGVDVLKVGSSLGIGSPAFWNGEKAIRIEETDNIFCEVKNQDKLSEVKVKYTGWKINNITTDVSTTLSIEKGSYLTKYSINLSKDLPNISTGIVKHPDSEIKIIENIKAGWNCLVSFGVQTLQEDELGMCIVYRADDLIEITEDEYSDVVVLKPEDKKLTYYFGAAWVQDHSGVKSMEEFELLLKDQVKFIR